jgi:hypothetical protein
MGRIVRLATKTKVNRQPGGHKFERIRELSRSILITPQPF